MPGRKVDVHTCDIKTRPSITSASAMRKGKPVPARCAVLRAGASNSGEDISPIVSRLHGGNNLSAEFVKHPQSENFVRIAQHSF